MNSSSSKVYIAGFSDKWTEKDVAFICGSYGVVKKIQIYTNKMGKPYTVVTFAAPSSGKGVISVCNPAEEAVYELDGARIHGARLQARIFYP